MSPPWTDSQSVCASHVVPPHPSCEKPELHVVEEDFIESRISPVYLTGAANKAVSPELLIIQQTWPLKAKGKL